MNNPKLPAPAMQEAAKANPLSDEYVNAVIQRYGYQSPETVIARLNQWIGLHGGEDSVTLLMYEAHKALSKLRADGVPSAQPAFWIDLEPISGSQSVLIRQWQNLGALGPGKHTLFLSPAADQASAPVADEDDQPIAPDDDAISDCWVNASDCDGIAYDGLSFERGYRAALANAPVTPAEVTAALDWLDDFVARCNGDDRGGCEPVNLLRRALASAPVAGEAQRSCPSGDGSLRPPCAKHPKESHHE